MSGVNALAVLNQGRPPSIYHGRSSSLNTAAQANIPLGFAVVTYRGKIWRLVYQGDEDIVRDPVRPDQPAGTIEVVIIGAAAAVSKQYYIKPYTEGSDQAPDCYSLDGIKPEANAPFKQSALCARCPQNEWGSRVTDSGAKAKRCADSKRLAIVPALDLENDSYGGPMLLRIPPTSLANLSLYAGNLSRMGAPMEAVVTKIGFNFEVAYPQLTFTPLRWLTDEEARLVVGPDGKSGVMAHPVVSRILVDSVAQAAVGESDPDEPEESPAEPTPPPPPPPAAEPQGPPAPDVAAHAQREAQNQAIAEAQQAAAFAREKEAEEAQAKARKVTPMRRPAAFGGAVDRQSVDQAPRSTAPGTPPPNGAAAPVSTAPAGLNAAIDALLATRVD